MYDIFYVSARNKQNNTEWKSFKVNYPFAKFANSVHEAQTKSLTSFFWIVWDDIIVESDFKFDYQPDMWSNEYIHVFKNGDFYDGICLLPKVAVISDREIQYRFFVKKKELEITASRPKPYDIFEIDTYDEYLSALESSTTEMFWMSSRNIIADIPDLYFDHSNTYDRNMNHVFVHQVGDQKLNNGLFLCSKHTKLTQREIEFRHLVNRKEWDIIASRPKPYDIVFISYQEPNADTNYELLVKRFPQAKRIHGVKGIHQAHIAAANICETDMFWVVDGDATLIDEFNFDFQVPRCDYNSVYVWKSQNPINDLVYGYGGVKLFPRCLTLNMDTTHPDMTTSISEKFNLVDEVSNITAFNTDPFNTWKSAFRECAKLSSGIIDRQNDYETAHRLMTWTTVGKNRPFGEFALQGAIAGRNFGLFSGNSINLINDFDWLNNQFTQSIK
jgi:hypothetical protein